MFHLFRTEDRRGDEFGEASRRNDAAYDDLREALEWLLAERNGRPAAPPLAPKERET